VALRDRQGDAPCHVLMKEGVRKTATKRAKGGRGAVSVSARMVSGVHRLAFLRLDGMAAGVYGRAANMAGMPGPFSVGAFLPGAFGHVRRWEDDHSRFSARNAHVAVGAGLLLR